MSSPPTKGQSAQKVPTHTLYENWAETYDTDGNILQAIDDQNIPALFKQAFNLLCPSQEITVTELGCGTGRNTVKLLDHFIKGPRIVRLNALDFSQAMLEKTRAKVEKLPRPQNIEHPTKVRYIPFDASDPVDAPRVPEVDLVVSTLVLEHLPIDNFFLSVKRLLNPGGVLVLTNMHSEMGRESRAGFRDEETGMKFQGESFAHTIEEVMIGGAKYGFIVDGPVVEKSIKKEDVELKLIGERGRKWIGYKVWYGFVMQLEGVRRSEAQIELEGFDAGTEKECAEI